MFHHTSAASSGYGMGCLCHSPFASAVQRRLNSGLSRRDVLRGMAGLATGAALGAPALVWGQAAPRAQLLKNVRIFDGLSPQYLEGRSVLILGNRIEAILGQDEPVADAEVIDCGGRVLMPGLIDAHWHTMLAGINQMVALTADIGYLYLVAAEEAKRTLHRGFTSVRDMGGPAFPLKRAIDERRFEGPRIYPSGAMISQTAGHGDFRSVSEVPRTPATDLSLAETAGIAAVADGVPEVLRRSREQLMQGASQLKVMVGGGVSSLHDPIDTLQYTVPEIRAVVDCASDWGTYAAAHVYTPAGILRALQCGVRSIEHGQLADEAAVQRIVADEAWWSLQPFLADNDANPGGNAEQQRQREEIAEGTVQAFTLGKRYHAKMAWGTDILFNPSGTRSQNRQLAKMTRWFTPAEALSLATARNGELLALSGPRNPYAGKVGVIATGALADLLLVEGDPLADLEVIASPEENFRLIMKDGQVFKNTLATNQLPTPA